jgi:uncharacterized lipoprotein YmbA
MSRWLCLAALLPLAACVSQGEMDRKLFQAEQLRLQRDMVENERLRLWLDYRGGRR